MPTQAKGRLIIIGGHEDRNPEGERTILRKVVSATTKSNNRLVLITVATELPRQVTAEYEAAFRSLDIEMEPLDIRSREDACNEDHVRKIERAAGSSSPAATSCASAARSATRWSSAVCASATAPARPWSAPRPAPQPCEGR